MENEQTSIHDFDVTLICEYFSSMHRQGPGSESATLEALGYIKGLTDLSEIADLGCGTGAQTVTIARNAKGHITALDLFPKFIDILTANVAKEGLSELISCVVGSMDNLPFAAESLDAIWSEGAIYNIGFRKGIEYWKSFLKPEGYLAVSEACWLTDSRPEEIEAFWTDAYPEIDTAERKKKQITAAGYDLVADFVLPKECWTDFYALQIDAQEKFLQRYPDNSTVRMLVENERREAELYAKYSDCYGYIFFVMKKRRT